MFRSGYLIPVALVLSLASCGEVELGLPMDAGSDIGGDGGTDAGQRTRCWPGGTTCGPSEYCIFPMDSPCGIGGVSGVCRPRPQVCPEYTIATCGCDGTLYASACMAIAAGTDVDPSDACQEH